MSVRDPWGLRIVCARVCACERVSVRWGGPARVGKGNLRAWCWAHPWAGGKHRARHRCGPGGTCRAGLRGWSPRAQGTSLKMYRVVRRERGTRETGRLSITIRFHFRLPGSHLIWGEIEIEEGSVLFILLLFLGGLLFFLKSSVMFTAKRRGRCRDFPRATCATINVTHLQAHFFFTKDEPTLNITVTQSP